MDWLTDAQRLAERLRNELRLWRFSYDRYVTILVRAQEGVS